MFLIVALLLGNIGKDWYDFSQCGAVDQCLSASKTVQYFLKFAMSFLLTVLAFVTARDSFSARDGHLLRTAFVFSLLADFAFSVFNVIVPDSGCLSTALGIGFFMVFQVILIYRHSRKAESDRSIPKVYGLLAAALVAGGVLFVTGKFCITSAIVFAYAFFVIASVVVGYLARYKGYFAAGSTGLIFWGMFLFFWGDAFVGLSMLSGDDHSVKQLIATVANNFIWVVYVPAQLLLIKATLKPRA